MIPCERVTYQPGRQQHVYESILSDAAELEKSLTTLVSLSG